MAKKNKRSRISGKQPRRQFLEQECRKALELHFVGQSQEAIKVLRGLTVRSPKYSDARFKLVDIYLANEKSDLALKELQAIIRHHPDSYRGRKQLAELLLSLDRFPDAAIQYRKGIDLVPDSGDLEYEILLSASQAFKKSGAYDEALRALEQALKINHDSCEAYYQLAALSLETGDRERACYFVRKALVLDPAFTDGLRLLAEIEPSCFAEKRLDEIKTMIRDPKTGDDDRANLCFAAFEILESQGKYRDSFKYLALGNSASRNTFEYDFGEHKETLLRIRNYFARCLEEYKGVVPQSSSVTPIFIVGMPRSGTTLVEQILASHSQISPGGELTILPGIVENLITEHVTLSAVTTSILEQVHLQDYAEEYLTRLASVRCNGSPFVTDKMPQNFLFIGLIRLLFPKAKIIHCVRHPVATAFSCYKTLFTGKGQQFSFDLIELGNFYLLYREIMAFWREIIAEDILDFHYEDLLDDQEGQTKKLLQFCGLPWDECCLSFHRIKRVVGTASALQVTRPLYRTSLAQWENHRDDLAPLISIIGE